MISLAERGMSLQGIANSVSMSRQELFAARVRDRSLDDALMGALARYEASLIDTLSAGGPDAAQAERTLARRFPDRHGADPRFRARMDQHVEDEPDASDAPSSSGDLLSQAINRLLDDREGPRE